MQSTLFFSDLDEHGASHGPLAVDQQVVKEIKVSLLLLAARVLLQRALVDKLRAHFLQIRSLVAMEEKKKRRKILRRKFFLRRHAMEVVL